MLAPTKLSLVLACAISSVFLYSSAETARLERGHVVPELVNTDAQRIRPRKRAPIFTATAVDDEKFRKIDLDRFAELDKH